MSLSSLPQLRIVYFTSLGAEAVNGFLQLLDTLGQQVLLVVVTQGPATRPTSAYKDVVANIRPGPDVLVTSHIKRLPALLRGLEPDLIFVAGFPWRLPSDLLALPRLGSINAHPALLPHHRGPDPLFWTLMDGDTEAGLTIHRMEADFDTGPILAQGSFPLGPDDDSETIFTRLFPLAVDLVPRALAAVAAGAPGTPQPTAGASYARLRTPDDRVLDWTRSAQQLHNQVRAWGPVGALAGVDGEQWIVKRARLAPDAPPATPAVAPGTVVARDGTGLLVQTGAGLLRLVEIAPASTDAPAAETAVAS